MSIFKKLQEKLLPSTKLLCQGYVNPKIFAEFVSMNIPLAIPYLIACFVQQKDSFVDSPENAINHYYTISNCNQSIYRNKEEEHSEYIYRKIFTAHIINCKRELTKLSPQFRQLLCTWNIRINSFPGITFGDWYDAGFLIGFIDLLNIKVISIRNKRFYAMDDAGVAVHGRPHNSPKILAQHHVNKKEWGHNIKTNDIIKVEFELFAGDSGNQGMIKFYKNEMLVLEFDEICLNCDYRMFITMNSLSGCTIINFNCEIS